MSVHDHQRGVVRPDAGDLSGTCDSGAYEYNAGPVILAVSPSSGPVAGRTQVVINGADLEGTGAMNVTFGGIAATNVITDSSGQLITVDVAVAVLVGSPCQSLRSARKYSLARLALRPLTPPR